MLNLILFEMRNVESLLEVMVVRNLVWRSYYNHWLFHSVPME
jgi:hypothetical protein